MLFKDLKNQMLLPESELIINKHTVVRGRELVILGMTSQNNENKLWIIMHDDNNYNHEEFEYNQATLTNRRQMEENISRDTFDIHIKEMDIQGQKISFDSSTNTCLYEPYRDICMTLQHFAEKGVSIDFFDDYNTDNLYLSIYNQKDGEKFPEIDLSKPLDIKLHIEESFKSILAQKSMTVCFDEDYDRRDSFCDREDEKEYTFYINKVVHYDIWEDARGHFDSEKMKEAVQSANISDEQLEEMKNDYFEAVERVCPKGMDMIIIEYEAEEDIQLDFYTKSFLDDKIELKNKCGIFILKPDEKIGKHGLRNRICMLEAVDKNFDEKLDIELFFWYKKIPEEVILFD